MPPIFELENFIEGTASEGRYQLDVVILPATQRFRALLGMHATGDAAEVWDAYAPTVGAALDALLSLLFQATWTVPIYLLSFVLNQIWYQVLAHVLYRR